MVGESGRRKGESNYHNVSYDSQTRPIFDRRKKIADVCPSHLTMMCPIFYPKQKVADVCPWSVRVGHLPWVKKLSSSGRGRSEGKIMELEKNRWVHSLRLEPTMARRRPIFYPKQKIADVCPWSVRVRKKRWVHLLWCVPTLRLPDIGRFLTRDKKLPRSGSGRSEGEIR